MGFSLGIVGLPNVGKSTLFNALLKRQVAFVANYPFATIEPNVGVVDVPDTRLKVLSDIVKKEYGDRYPRKVIPAIVKFYDIAGLVKGAHKGEGLGNEFLGHIRSVDAIVHLVRNFNDPQVVNTGTNNPQSDRAIVDTELILADLQLLEKAIGRLENDLKKEKSPQNLRKLEVYKKGLVELNKGRMLGHESFSDEEKSLFTQANLLTVKPFIVVYNTGAQGLSNIGDQNVNSWLDGTMKLNAKTEAELAGFSPEEQVILSQGEKSLTGLDLIINKCYEILGLQTYFTAGPKEVHAWTCKRGTKAPQAAGIIHTDFERGFISAEIISVDKLAKVGGWRAAKSKGLIRLEGKSYTMQDGDVIKFNFSV